MALRRYIVWADVGGRTSATLPTTNTGAGAIQTALQAHSNAGVTNWFEGTVTDLTASPVDATFPDVTDIARLTFKDVAGNLVNLSLLAPKANIFLADGMTVDPSAIADIIAAAVGTLLSAAGNPVTTYIAGVRGFTKHNA